MSFLDNAGLQHFKEKLETVLAPKNSPALTGTPTAPTAAPSTNNTQIATTAFVNSAFQANDAMIFKGTIGSSGATVTSLPNTHYNGWTYKVATAGTYAGKACELGDMIICVIDGTSANDDHWTVVQSNVDGAVIGPTSSTDNHVATFNSTTGKIIKDSGYTIAKSVPSDAVFTDTNTKVTSSANHYTPATASGSAISASASGAAAAWSIDVVKGVTLQTDGKGHVTGLSVTSGKIPANPDTNTTYSFSNSAPTLAWNTTSTVGVVGGTALTVKMPANPNTNTTYSFSNSAPTLAWNTTSTVGVVGGVALTVKMPANPNTNTTYSFSNSAPTLAWNTTSTVGVVGGVALTVKLPANPNTNTTYAAGSGLALSGTTFRVDVPRVAESANHLPANNSFQLREYTNGTNYGLPSNAWYHIYEAKGSDGNYGTQLALGMTTDAVYYRKYASASWGSWYSLINTNTTYSFSNSAPTLSWGTTSTVGVVGGTALTVKMPANPNTNTTYAFTNSAPTLAWNTTSTVGVAGGVAFTVKMPANPNTNTTYGNATTSAAGLVSTGAQSFAGNKTFTGVVTVSNATASTAISNGALVVSGGIACSANSYFKQIYFPAYGGSYGTSGQCALWYNGAGTTQSGESSSRMRCGGDFQASKVYGAVWNDYAEYRKAEIIEGGRCVYETEEGIMKVSHSRLQAGCRLTSDTFGTCMGETAEAKTPIAVAGRVLVYPYTDRKNFHLGDAVCSAPDGTIDVMTRDEICKWPDRIIGTVSEIPSYDVWEGGSVNEPNPIQVNGRIWIYVR